jgi:hypothetical protein
MLEILSFLGSLMCAPRFEIVSDPTLLRVAEQRGSIVRTRTDDPGVIVHELWHVCQEQRLGVAATDAESARREHEARTVELMWRGR